MENDFQKFIYTSRYSRWLEKENRRETWDETVDRYITHMKSIVKEKTGVELTEEFSKARDFIYNLKVMPSMRGLMTAGKALKRDEARNFQLFIC